MIKNKFREKLYQDNKMTRPVGLGVGKMVKFGKLPVNFQIPRSVDTRVS